MLLYDMLHQSYNSKSHNILNSCVLQFCQVIMYFRGHVTVTIIIVSCYSRASVIAHFIIPAPTKEFNFIYQDVATWLCCVVLCARLLTFFGLGLYLRVNTVCLNCKKHLLAKSMYFSENTQPSSSDYHGN
jgi:hypothetical protein